VWIPIRADYNRPLAIAMAVVYGVIVLLIGASYKSTFGINRGVLDGWAGW
jgi:hypothetical protein